METVISPHFAGLVAAGLWELALLLLILKEVETQGTWYNQLKLEERNTFKNRLVVTLRDRLAYKKVGTLATVGPVAAYFVVRVVVTGVIYF